MGESIDEMIRQKDTFQIKANELRKTRDALHNKSKKMADERDELTAQIREIRNKISNHKKARDEFNERVKHAKEERNSLIVNHGNIKKTVRILEKEKLMNTGVNLTLLKQTLRKLENEQMTQILSAQKEKKLIESIAHLHMQIKEQEEMLRADPKLKEAIEEEKILGKKIEKIHENMAKLAKRAQEEHESMIELVKSLDTLGKRANELQETIVMTKIEADKVHKDFIEHVNRIHELERTISETEKKKYKEKKLADVTTAQKEANDIYEKFKRGEKLSTEDLMVLQKAGLI
ncbi:MAG: hypothetical protein V1726_07020 [Methanobacteriota archaeon]